MLFAVFKSLQNFTGNLLYDRFNLQTDKNSYYLLIWDVQIDIPVPLKSNKKLQNASGKADLNILSLAQDIVD